MAVPNNRKNSNTPWPIIILWVVIAIICIQGYLLIRQKVAKPLPVKEAPVKPRRQPVEKPEKPSLLHGKIAIVIDDWGFNRTHCKFFETVGAPVAPAVLPNLAYSKDIIQCAIDAGQEPILHLPLEPYKNNDAYPKDYILTTEMSQKTLINLLTKILNDHKGVVGVNNHMGSKATENRPMMTVILKEIKSRGLFFVDSVTSVHSVCPIVAKDTGILFSRRDVFLDNRNERASIERAFDEGVKIANRQGFALLIGHDRALTLQIIQEKVSKYKKQGIEFLSLKEYIKAHP